MRVFILEDDPERIKWFVQRFIGHSLTMIASCADIDEFQPPYDLVCLDHDLGGRQMEWHEDNGEEFAKLIEDKINPDAIVVIHSYNPPGARNILKVLEGGLMFVKAAPFRTRAFVNAIRFAEITEERQ